MFSNLLLIFFTLFFSIGCSNKEINLQLSSTQIEDINLEKGADFLFYAYLKDGVKLQRLSKEQISPQEDEEIIRVFKKGYYPIYDIYQKGRGCNSKSPLNSFCHSFYTKKDNIGLDTSLNIIGSLVGLTLSRGFEYHKVFDFKKFQKNIIKSKLPLIKKIIKKNNFTLLNIKSITLNKKIIKNINISNNLLSDILILYDENQNFKEIIDIKELKKQNIFKSIALLTQHLINAYFQPRKATNIKFLIPPKIQKPILPAVPKLIKSEFETKEMFNNRVKQAMLQREEQIRKLQLDFRQKVEERNQKVEELQRLHQEDLRQIEAEEKAKKENIQKYMPYFTSIAMRYLVGNLALKNLRYDAENKLMYADLYGSNKNYHKKVYLKVPLDKARAFKSKKYYSPVVTYKYSQNRLMLNEIKVDNYYAKLAQTDYKPKKIEVKLKDKKIDTHYAQNDLSLQNPNLKDKYTVIGLSYTEDADGIIANFQDDLPNLISKSSKATKDPKKWLFVIGAENYDNTDNVPFSKRSAETFVEVAQKCLGVTKGNIYTFIEDNATSGAIEDNLNRMLENVKEGDSIYFFYSGHGIPVLPNREPYMLPKDKIPDYIGRSPFFKLNNIYSLLSNSKASKIIAIMDSCFSGATDGVSIIKGVAGSRLVPKKVTFNHNKMVVLTAGRDKQFSNMYPKKGHRLFSYFVMKSLLEGKRSVKDVYNNVFPKVKSTSNGFGDLKRQEPTIEGNKGLSF